MTTYYVSATGNDGNNGTSPLSAWKSIDKVNASTFSPGDQILFEGGQTFNGGLYFGPNESGTLSNPISIGSYGSGRATINAPSSKDGFFAYNAGGFILSKLIFTGAGATATAKQGISFYNDLPGNTKLQLVQIDNITVSGFRNGILIGSWNGSSGYNNVRITNAITHDNLEAGISMYGYPLSASQPSYAHTNVYIGSCISYNNFGDPYSGRPSGNGIVLGGVDGAVIERCVAHDNGKNNLTNAGPVGIWVYDTNNALIQHNESYHNQTSGTGDGDGFDLDINTTNSILQYNYSHDNDGAGFLVYADAQHPNSNNIVRYNISENDAQKLAGYGGITIGGSVSNIDVYGNTIYTSSGANDPAAFRVTTWGGTPQNIRVWNNIFYGHYTGAGSVKVIDSPANSTYLFQGNNYYSDVGPTAIRWGSAVYSGLASWLTAAPAQERLDGVIVAKNVDPQFVNAGQGGTIGNAHLLESLLTAYRLREGSALINSGINLTSLYGVNTGSRDFNGDAIPMDQSFDIGADEINAGSPPPPPPTNDPLFRFCLAAPASLDGLPVLSNDIMGYMGGSAGDRFQKSLKGDTIGLSGLSISDFKQISDSELLFTLRSPATLQGMAYDDSDILRATKQSDGTYLIAMFFDGSDVGLTKSSEAIDAFEVERDQVTGAWQLILSTRGAVSVSGATGYGEDLLGFRATTTGVNTSGSWGMVFDGSDVGLGGSSENINGVAKANGILYLSTAGSFSAGTLTGNNQDIFAFSPNQLGSTTIGTFASSLFFDGSQSGLGAASLAGFDL